MAALSGFFKDVNPYMRLSFVASIFIALSIIFDSQYMLLWLLLFGYGIIGFAADRAFDDKGKFKKPFMIVLFVGFIIKFGLATLFLSGVGAKMFWSIKKDTYYNNIPQYEMWHRDPMGKGLDGSMWKYSFGE